ncbi:diguanylate cyclase [Fusibacter paucivorans]|uniref:Diguanylate cyclase n=1 Tax=Fusibacter paucivorans TaxID=76009 RepID=A0ABS5PNV0_9FIRM|nr:diguanylate cyclase [Fusibacter paucivorans]MBS7526261.1 diguanylate cyclase [Fusibacter paucivorans]
MLDLLTVYFFAATVLTAFASAYLYARGKAKQAIPVLALSMSICFYVFGYNIELHMNTIQTKLFWNYFQYIGIPFVSAFWLLTALIYTHRLKRHKWLKYAYVFGIPLLTFIFRFTNAWHHLYFTHYWLVEDSGIFFLAKGKGPWFYVQSLHSMSMVLMALIIYIISYKRREKFEGNSVSYMLGASLIACGGLIVNILGLGLDEIDHMVVFLPLTIPVVLMAVIKENFWEIRTRVRDMIFEDNADALVLFNKARLVVDFNWEAQRLFKTQNIVLKTGETHIQQLQKTPFAPIADSLLQESEHRAIIALHYAEEMHYYEFKLLTLNKHRLETESFLLSLQNVTERERFQQMLQFQASTDSLSGLLNRRAFFERVGQCGYLISDDRMDVPMVAINSLSNSVSNFDGMTGQAQTQKRCYLLMLDIDHFKRINDTYGHAVGDIVITEIGKILKSYFHSADVVGRIGGEEFAVFYAAIEHEKLLQLITAFMDALKHIESASLPSVSASIGVAETDGKRPVEILMKEADKALYYAKETGRNKAVFYNAIAKSI